jgi:HEAT repeat protein
VAAAVAGLWCIPKPVTAGKPRAVVQPTHPPAISGEGSVEGDLRDLESGRRGEALARLRHADPYHLERAFLDRARPSSVRMELLRILEERGDAAARLFLLDVLRDATEDMLARLVALQLVAARRDDEGCDAVVQLWSTDESWPAAARYHLIHALGVNGRPAAKPVVVECAKPLTSVEIRGHAVQALGSWSDDTSVRERLKKVATTDGVPLIRVNALGALVKSPARDVDDFLTLLAATGDEVGRAAKEFLKRR